LLAEIIKVKIAMAKRTFTFETFRISIGVAMLRANKEIDKPKKD